MFVVLPFLLLLLLLLVQLLQNHSSLLLLQSDFLEKTLLLSSVSLELLALLFLNLLLVFLESFLDLHLVLLTNSKLLLLFSFVLLDFSISVVINLVEKVDSGLFSLVPFFLLLFLFLHSLDFNQSVKFFLVSKHILALASYSSEGSSCFFSFFLFHQFFVLGKLSFLENNSFNHESVSLFLLPDDFFLLKFDFLILSMDCLKSIFLLVISLSLFEFRKFSLLFPLMPEHFLLFS